MELLIKEFINAKWFLRIAWVAELGLLVLTSIVLVFWRPDRISTWMLVLPILITAVAAQGAVAAGGSQLKRLTEAKLEKAKCQEPAEPQRVNGA